MATQEIFTSVNLTTEKSREKEGFTIGASNRFTKENGATTINKAKG